MPSRALGLQPMPAEAELLPHMPGILDPQHQELSDGESGLGGPLPLQGKAGGRSRRGNATGKEGGRGEERDGATGIDAVGLSTCP